MMDQTKQMGKRIPFGRRKGSLNKLRKESKGGGGKSVVQKEKKTK